ncbi:MAG: primosomal protein N' [bacterium]|nr:primosomal protein N' [bacterium]
MHIVDVIPLATIPRPHPQVYSYFSPRILAKGALVEVPMGRRTIEAVALETRPIGGSKFEIRKSAVLFKSIRKVISEQAAYTEQEIALALWISKRYWASLGKTMGLCIPQASTTTENNIMHAPSGLTHFAEGPDRLSEYRVQVKQSLAEGMQALLLCPDVLTAKAYAKELSADSEIGSQISLFKSSTSKKARLQISDKLHQANPLLVIGTRSALFLPFRRLELVIVEQAGAPGYEAWGRTPRYDAVETAKKLAKLHGAKIIFGDVAPTISHPSKTISSPTASEAAGNTPSIELIDLRYQKYWGSRHPLTTPVKDALRRAIRGERPFDQSADTASRKQAIILMNRKGVAGALVCHACGYIPRCADCNVALALHPSKTFSQTALGSLRCHHCYKEVSPPKQCPKCKSYRIWPIGSGTVQIEADLKKLVPEARIARIDSDRIKKESDLESALAAFREKKTDILIGTQMMLKDALLDRAAIAVVVNADQFFIFPTYDAATDAWRTLSLLRAKATERFFIQTLDPETPALKFFSDGNEKAFFEEEIERRKSFGYPPFGELIRLTFAHPDKGRAAYEAKVLFNELSAKLKAISDKLKADILGPSPAFIPRERGKWKYVLLLKLPPDVDGETRSLLLEHVPPSWQVHVNPKELL